MVGGGLGLTGLDAAMLKYDGIFPLQAKGEGHIHMVVVDVTSAGAMRAHARFDADAFGAGDIGDGTIARLFGGGHLSFTVDQGPDTERYQGITELAGASLSECAHTHFRQSEQLRTAIQLAVASEAGGRAARAPRMMVQPRPDGPAGFCRPPAGGAR